MRVSLAPQLAVDRGTSLQGTWLYLGMRGFVHRFEEEGCGWDGTVVCLAVGRFHFGLEASGHLVLTFRYRNHANVTGAMLMGRPLSQTCLTVLETNHEQEHRRLFDG